MQKQNIFNSFLLMKEISEMVEHQISKEVKFKLYYFKVQILQRKGKDSWESKVIHVTLS